MTIRSPQAGRMEKLFGWLPTAKSRTTATTTAPASAKVERAVERTFRHKTLLTTSELTFMHVLTRVVQDRCLIVAKARIADLFGLRQEEENSATFTRMGCRHVDFLLCDPRTSEMLAAIQVDRPRDISGRIERDRMMDRLFNWNRLPLIRVPSSFIYAPEKLRRELAGILGEGRLLPLAH